MRLLVVWSWTLRRVAQTVASNKGKNSEGDHQFHECEANVRLVLAPPVHSASPPVLDGGTTTLATGDPPVRWNVHWVLAGRASAIVVSPAGSEEGTEYV